MAVRASMDEDFPAIGWVFEGMHRFVLIGAFEYVGLQAHLISALIIAGVAQLMLSYWIVNGVVEAVNHFIPFSKFRGKLSNFHVALKFILLFLVIIALQATMYGAMKEITSALAKHPE